MPESPVKITDPAATDESARASQLERGRLTASLRRGETKAAAVQTPRTRFSAAGLGNMALAAAREMEPKPLTEELEENEALAGRQRGPNAMAVGGGISQRPGRLGAEAAAATSTAVARKKNADNLKKKKADAFKRQFVYPLYATVWADWTFMTFIGLNVYWFMCLTKPNWPFKMAIWEKLYMVFVDCLAPAILFFILIIVFILACALNPICWAAIGAAAVIGLVAG